MEKNTYTVVGVSRLNGEVKVRFAHDQLYVKGLAKAGNTDIELVDAPEPMGKAALVEFLKTTPLYENAEYREAIDARAEMYAVKAGTAVKEKALKGPKAGNKDAPKKEVKKPKKETPAPKKVTAVKATKVKATTKTTSTKPVDAAAKLAEIAARVTETAE
jgi:hypothetical protein